MVGTGKGALQPTKPITTDDFVPALALPGYYSVYVGNTQTAATHTLFSVPDGMTAEVVDFGMTVGNQAVVSTSGVTSSNLSFNVLAGKGTAATTLMTAADISAGATTAAIGSTLSALRKSTGYSFHADSVALGNKFGSGCVVQANIADNAGAGAPGACTLWVRIKWISKDTGVI